MVWDLNKFTFLGASILPENFTEKSVSFLYVAWQLRFHYHNLTDKQSELNGKLFLRSTYKSIAIIMINWYHRHIDLFFFQDIILW